MVKNENVSKRILQILDTLIDGGQFLYKLADERLFVEFEEIAEKINTTINTLYNIIINIKEKEDLDISTDIQCESAIYSLSKIRQYSRSRSKKILDKIEFEFIPLLQEIKLNFYYWGYIYRNKDREDYYKYQVNEMIENRYIDEAEKTQIYKYDLSVVILAYNKLEYTKLCVESLLKYIPKNINYELILVNHGSNDGTKEYFEEISPTKQVDILRNGGGVSLTYRILEGKYTLAISNDVLITKNAIENMITCIESDENIAWVVPTTPNVSNLQSIEGYYEDMDQMYLFSEKNNISNQYRWEQRPRLCNPIDLRRTSVYYSSKVLWETLYFSTQKNLSFIDDISSLLTRRNGYKMILAKDAYCYHFGSVTLKDEIANYKNGNNEPKDIYTERRKEFKDTFGVDPWGTGFCWDPQLIKELPCDEIGHIDVLGINCGIGSNPLKIKESIKEKARNLDVTTYNVTDEASYIEDLKGVSDVTEYVNTCEDIENTFKAKKFKYIVFESKFEIYNNPLKILSDLKDRIVEGGIIAIKISDINLKMKIKKAYSNTIQSGEWIILKK